ncbi:transmembrane protein 80-like isoform X1 [Narcine bancroftii]|uniref:transmembrane protein 80-like isoform X1 n=3 Tax=Narcine bancroftii TaxID=1343680 RepID=UPI00383198B7
MTVRRLMGYWRTIKSENMVLKKVNSTTVLSSIPLQMIYYFNIFYFIFYILATFLMVIYKSQVFTFPGGYLALDLVLLILMIILEVTRLYHGFKGNLTEETVPIVINLVLTIGSMLLSLYYLLWQTYVLKADVIMNAILLIIYGLEEILDIIAVSSFARTYT